VTKEEENGLKCQAASKEITLDRIKDLSLVLSGKMPALNLLIGAYDKIVINNNT